MATMRARALDWWVVPPGLQREVCGLLGASWGDVHRSHLPELTAEQRAAVLEGEVAPKVPDSLMEVWKQRASLRDYQIRAATFAYDRVGSLLAMSMGTGKTRTSLCSCYSPGGVGIIVAPLVAWAVWKKEIKLVYGDSYPVTEVRGRLLAKDDSLQNPGIYLINPEIVNERWSEWNGCFPAFVILDEAHLYTNKHTKRHQGAQNLCGQAKKRIALTGTPVLRHLVDLYGILRCVVPGAFGSYYEFALALGAKHGSHGLDIGSVPKAAREWLDRRMAEVAVYMRWEDVASVPPITRERLPVTLSDADAREYNRLQQDVRAILGGQVRYQALLDAVKLLEVSTLRRFIGRAKVPAVADLVRSTNEPVVVWTWHKDVARAVAAALHGKGVTAEVVTGDDNQDVRDSAIARFQSGAYRVFVGTIAAAGVGVDLTRARITVIAEPSWLPAEIAQAEARVFRSGQTQPCITYWPMVAGTIEERVIEVLLAKEKYADSRALGGISGSTAPSHDAVLDSLVALVDLVVK